MDNKGLAIFTIFLDAANLIAFFFSFQLENKGVVSALSLLAILAFSSIWFLEHLRKQATANIKVETPKLSHAEIMMRNSRLQARRSFVEIKLDECKKKQEERIQETNTKYLDHEKTIFVIGVFITIVIACFLFFS